MLHLQRNKRCVASCKKKFTWNTPFCNCNCCVASCKKSRTTLYFSQRCDGDKLLACNIPSAFPLSNLQRSFVRMGQSELIFRSREISRCVRHLVCCCKRCKLRKKLQTCDTPSATWKIFYSSSLRCKLQEKLLRVTGLTNDEFETEIKA